jgi:hypothetical protein
MASKIKDVSDRQFKYEAKTESEQVKATNDRVRSYALRRHHERQNALANFENQAKDTIDQQDIPSALYVSYLNYCRELWKKANTYNNEVLRNETNAIIAKWKVRGLDEDIMKYLRTGLINTQ